MSITATGDHDRVDARPRRPWLPSGLLRLASDERLVELLRAGSDAAFEAMYARHHRGVLAFCRHMLGSADEAEDAVQHAFLAAYRDIAGSAKEINLRPWLYAIARNRCLTVLRSRRELAGAEPPEPSTEHLSAEVERRHELRALLGDLGGLPDDQRAALVLAELDDMSHDEIGEALGCPREKVKALVFQARSSLIASRDAREAPCAEIREQLANLRGGALRRNVLRRHLRACAGCREFRDEVRTQRHELGLILPVAPSLGLQAAVLGGGGAAATTAVVAKTAIVLAVAGGGVAAVEEVGERSEERAARPAVTAPRAPAAVPVAPVAAGAVVEVRRTGQAPGVGVRDRLDGGRVDDRARGGDRVQNEAVRGRGRSRGQAERVLVGAERGAAGEPGVDGGRALGRTKGTERGLGLGRERGGGPSARAFERRAPKSVRVKPLKAKPEKRVKPPKIERDKPPQAQVPPAQAAPPAKVVPTDPAVPTDQAESTDQAAPAEESATLENGHKADKQTD